jgi:hypothetical protein
MWIVRFSTKAGKAAQGLPLPVQTTLWLLVGDLSLKGPVAGNWPNYSKLDRDRHHCHIKKGRPTYVAVWREVGDEAKTIEVTYAGTHEKAPY